MTNRDRVLRLIRAHPGLTDAQITARTGIRPHQQVNRICRSLATECVITRERGPEGLIVNVPSGEPSGRSARPSTAPRRTARRKIDRRTARSAVGAAGVGIDAPTLVLVQCSKAKSHGGQPELDGRGIGDLLPQSLASALAVARETVARAAHRDERRLMPASSRYAGRLYESAGHLIAKPPPGANHVILSGGYGLVLPEEPIGDYDRKFRIGDWPSDLLEQCLLEVTRALDCARVVALCADTSDYARLVRRTPWKRLGIDVRLGCPDMAGRGGAQLLVPRAMGEALSALATGGIDEGWSSGDGVSLVWERLA